MQVYTYFCLAKQGKLLGAYKLARTAYNKLLTFKCPPQWRDQVDMSCLTIRTARYSDKDELLPVCYRCSTSNPLLNSSGDYCINCNHPFIRSFCSFETLPLVEFELCDGISTDEAAALIEQDPMDKPSAKKSGADDDDYGDANVLKLGGDDDEVEEETEDDSFHQQLMNLEQNMDGSFPSIKVDRNTLIGTYARACVAVWRCM